MNPQSPCLGPQAALWLEPSKFQLVKGKLNDPSRQRYCSIEATGFRRLKSLRRPRLPRRCPPSRKRQRSGCLCAICSVGFQKSHLPRQINLLRAFGVQVYISGEGRKGEKWLVDTTPNVCLVGLPVFLLLTAERVCFWARRCPKWPCSVIPRKCGFLLSCCDTLDGYKIKNTHTRTHTNWDDG